MNKLNFKFLFFIFSFLTADVFAYGLWQSRQSGLVRISSLTADCRATTAPMYDSIIANTCNDDSQSSCYIQYFSNSEGMRSTCNYSKVSEAQEPTPTPPPPPSDCPSGQSKVGMLGNKPVCADECGMKAGQTAVSGVFSGTKNDGSDVPVRVCHNGCFAYFSGNTPSYRRLVDGQYRFYSKGAYKYAGGYTGNKCTVGPETTVPTSSDAPPENKCGVGQSLGQVGDKIGCFDESGKLQDPNNPPPKCPEGSSSVELNGNRICANNETGQQVPSVTSAPTPPPVPPEQITTIGENKVTNPDGSTTTTKSTKSPDGSTKTETTKCSADGKTCETTVSVKGGIGTVGGTASGVNASGVSDKKYDKDGNEIADGFCSDAILKDTFVCKGIKLTKKEEGKYDFAKAATDYTESEKNFKSTLTSKMNEFKGLFDVDMPTGGSLEFSRSTVRFGDFSMDLGSTSLLQYVLYVVQFLFGMAIIWILIF